jgi:hypothetical protein
MDSPPPSDKSESLKVKKSITISPYLEERIIEYTRIRKKFSNDSEMISIALANFIHELDKIYKYNVITLNELNQKQDKRIKSKDEKEEENG